MTFPFTGTGGFFTRVGHIGGTLNQVNTQRNNSTLNPFLNNIQAQYLAADQGVIAGLFPAGLSWQAAQNTFATYLQTISVNTLIQMETDFIGTIPQTKAACMTALVSQMVAGAQTVPQPTTSVSVASGGSNVGNGVCVMTITDPVLCVNRDYVFAETLVATVTTDSFSGGATAGLEGYTVNGQAAESNPLYWDFPLGSGTSATFSVISAQDYGDSAGNILVNGDFETFTGNTPNFWTGLLGTPGTNFLAGGSVNAYAGANCLEILGDAGLTKTALYQIMNNSGSGSGVALLPLTEYVYSFVVKTSVGGGPAAGTLAFQLTDGNNSPIADQLSNTNVKTFNLASGGLAVGTSYVRMTGVFRTPALVPASGYRIQLGFPTTALTSGAAAYIDQFAIAQASPLYAGGPLGAVFNGSVPFLAGDLFNITVANNYSSLWQVLLERIFGMRALGLQAPSGGSPTIANGLVA